MAAGSRQADREGMFSGNRVERAIIDIGSNTVRLVLYGGSPRAPVTLFNEKVAARLGKEIATTGQLPDDSVKMALRGLERFSLLLREWGVDRIDVVATAAVREAANGPAFLKTTRDMGFEPRLLSGEDEARISAMGILGAFPGAEGVVADLGGGSLELVQIGSAEGVRGISLPLGTLRLPEYLGQDDKQTCINLKTALGRADHLTAHGGSLYLVGGTWRSMAVVAMEDRNYPLTDPHGFTLPASEAAALAETIAASDPANLSNDPRVSQMRAEYLPDAGVLLKALLDKLKPDAIVFSSWGLREGILFDELEPIARKQDPLLAGVGEFAMMRGTPPMLATQTAGWTVGALRGEGRGHGSERLRMAATMLALASMQIEPNLRVGLAMDWALHKRWIDVDACGRAMMAAAVAGNGNRCNLPKSLYELASAEQLEDAICWGLAIRLSRRLGGRSGKLFNVSNLSIQDTKLVLTLDESHAALFGQPTEKDMALLADRLSLDPVMRVAEN
ncbi:exopolyphosphatase [Pontixanthobacter gangjinensis]|uniref:Ppx/GppA family phosphatase n=1 Tax=Pontixanthobacter gangjinensis TaxID=1028742 RepID=A0A6I4SPM3_9SPHN|nr:Ppx/GppA family phosphatase [Pontixanthobacter gangjinensis]MXO57763.1 Ppx/GppA family phosphatase [Pontixanthobacter gangjinensis]